MTWNPWRYIIKQRKFFVLLGIIIGLGGAWIIWHVGLQWSLRRELASIKDQGSATSLQEYFDSLPHVPDQENGAMILKRGVINYREPILEIPISDFYQIRYYWLEEKRLPTSEQLDSMEAFIDANVNYLELLREAATSQQFDWGFRLTENHGVKHILSDDTDSLYMGANLLSLSVLIRAHHGDLGGAIEDAIVGLRLSKVILSGYGLQGVLASNFYQEEIVDSLYWILGRYTFTDAQLQKLAEGLQSLKDFDRVSSGFGYDIAYWTETIRDGTSVVEIGQSFWGILGPPGAGEIFFSRVSGTAKLQDINLIKFLKELDKIVRLPPDERFADLGKLGERINYGAGVRPRGFFSQLSYDVSKTGREATMGEADHLCTQFLGTTYVNNWFLGERRLIYVRIACMRYELKYGESPEHLQDLVPEFLDMVPQNPRNGKPFRYEKNPDGSFSLSYHNTGE